MRPLPGPIAPPSKQHGKAATKTSETIHTNKKHPFLTKEKGFLPVGQITLGMHVLRADGTYGVVTGWKVVPGTQVMHNLEVAQDHTFTVGAGEWVVHNSCSNNDRAKLRRSLRRQGQLLRSDEAHHIVPCEFQQNEVGARAVEGGFKFNSYANGVALPTTLENSRMSDLPYHNGPHPAYNCEIERRLSNTYENWQILTAILIVSLLQKLEVH